MTLADLVAVYRRWYELPRDIEVVHVTLAGVAANLADGDPFWLLLVAPPGSMKTEIIRSLSGCDFVYPLSSLTPQTFASGFQTKGDEPSLLMRLDQKIVTLKDFTTVLTCTGRPAGRSWLSSERSMTAPTRRSSATARWSTGWAGSASSPG